MAEYDMADLFEDVTLKIGEHTFRLREKTRALREKMEPVQKKLEALPDDADEDTFVEHLIEVVDIVLEPVGEGTRKHAKTLLSQGYQSSKIGSDRIVGLSTFLNQKMDERVPLASGAETGA